METLKEKIQSVPQAPGVYMFLDKKGRVLYIGKAKNLKNRLRSYFQAKEELSPRIVSMIKKAHDLSFIVTENELEALALEASLIKQQKPRYNIVLRDDKNYPYLRVDPQEPWPKPEVVRRIKKDGALYFGPYIPASAVWETLGFIRKYFRVRPCRYDLSRPRKPCLSYQMGRCPAPCAGLISREEYMENLNDVIRFLKGQKDELFEALEKKMKTLSEQLRFEEAAKVRDSIQALRRAFERQKVVSAELGDMDVVGLYREGSDSLLMVLFIRNGLLVGTKDFYLKDTSGEQDSVLIEEFMKFFYAKDTVLPELIIVEVLPEDRQTLEGWLSQKRGSIVKIKRPVREQEKALLAMARENA
ncbi:MAG: excinuclease ABC subunit C, partial [Nitrospirae bacterium]